jgi:hypothetical protein
MGRADWQGEIDEALRREHWALSGLGPGATLRAGGA